MRALRSATPQPDGGGVTILTREECEQWLASRYGDRSIDGALAAAFTKSNTFDLPADAHARTTLARSIVRAVSTSGGGLLWITAWGIFPSAQNMTLFDGYRASLGENRSLMDAPGHGFGEDDSDEVESVLDLALYFFWDATLFAGTTAVRVSHDEWLEVHGGDDLQLRQIEKHVGRA